MASLFLFLTSCSQSVGQIPLLEHRQPHTHTHPFSLTQKPTITHTQTHAHTHPHKDTHTHFQSCTHIRTPLFLTQKPIIKHTHTCTASSLSHNTHTNTHRAITLHGWKKKRAPRPFYRRMEGGRKRRLSFSLLFITPRTPFPFFNIFRAFLF